MKYQNPEILYALIAVLVPIIIHLLNLRKHKNIYFSSIRFLKKISEEKKQKLKLKNILSSNIKNFSNFLFGSNICSAIYLIK